MLPLKNNVCSCTESLIDNILMSPMAKECLSLNFNFRQSLETGLLTSTSRHLLVVLTLEVRKPVNKHRVMKRDWRHYSEESLISKLSTTQHKYGIDQVQPIWNNFETKLIGVVDELAPV